MEFIVPQDFPNQKHVKTLCKKAFEQLPIWMREGIFSETVIIIGISSKDTFRLRKRVAQSLQRKDVQEFIFSQPTKIHNCLVDFFGLYVRRLIETDQDFYRILKYHTRGMIQTGLSNEDIMSTVPRQIVLSYLQQAEMQQRDPMLYACCRSISNEIESIDLSRKRTLQ